MRTFLRWLNFGRNRDKRETALDDEIAFHLEEETAEREAAGMSAEEARRAARKDLGNPTVVKESTREAWGWTRLETWSQDVRYGLRALIKSPAFALTAVVSLALGIGANTAIYSIINSVMLRTLPVKNPQELVRLEIAGKTFGISFTNPLWESIRDSQDALAGIVAYSEARLDLSDGGESQFVRGLWVSGGYFDVLGVPALRGRVLDAQDDRKGCGSDGPVAVISYNFWQRQFNGNPGAVGSTLRLDRQAFTIVGVTPQWMRGLSKDLPYDVALPIGCEPLLYARSKLDQRSSWWLRIVGRLKPGAGLAETQSRLQAIAPEIYRATTPSYWNPEAQRRYMSYGLHLSPAAAGFSEVGERYRIALFALMAIAGLVLLIACANLANLLLARAAARQQEISMRMAIGASRGRLIRQLLTESVLLAGIGAFCGLLLATWGGRALVGFLSRSPLTKSPVEIELSPDLRVLGFTAAVAILTAFLFGLAPALRGTRVEANDVLKEHGRGAGMGSSRFRLGRGLAALQIGVSFVLLLAAGLFIGTLRNLMETDLGFRAEGVTLVAVDVQKAAKDPAKRALIYGEILDCLRKLPKVASASASTIVPLGRNTWNEWIASDGYGGASGAEALLFMNRVWPGYFQTMGTRLIAGRDFNDHDGPKATPVIIINESAAAQFFGSAPALGKTIRIGNAQFGTQFQVVGVVEDAKYARVDEAAPIAGFVAAGQSAPDTTLNFEVRHAASNNGMTQALRSAIAGVSPDISLEFRSLATEVDLSLQQQKLIAVLSALFGALALLLSMVGLYGVTAYSVVRRRAEIGLRMALGARTESVLWLILREVAVLLAIGTALGAVGALSAGRLLTTLLYGVEPTDPAQMLGAGAVLALATVLAAFFPAWSAARLDPMKVLREE